MPRVVVSKVEELPRELWFGRTGPLERLSLKKSIAKLEAAGLRPSWSRIDGLLAYLRQCVAELGSYAKCAAVIGATRNVIRDACRGRYVPGFDRLLVWGNRLAEHSRELSGLLLTVDLPDEVAAARRLAADQDPGVKPTATAWARSGRDMVNAARPVTVPFDPCHYTQGEDAPGVKPATARARSGRDMVNAARPVTLPLDPCHYTQGEDAPGVKPTATARARSERDMVNAARPVTPPLDPCHYTQGQDATDAESSPIPAWARPDTGASSKGLASPVPGLIPRWAGTCPCCGTATPLGAPAPTMRADTSFTQGEPTASAPFATTEPSALGVVSKAAPKIDGGLGVVSISAHTRVGEHSITALAPLGEHSIAALDPLGEHSKCTHYRHIPLGEDDVCEQKGVGVHALIEHDPPTRSVDKKSTKKSLPPRLTDPISVPVMVVAEFRYGGRSVRAGCFDTEEQARRAIDLLLDAKVYEGEPYIDGRLYTREKSQAELIDELVEKKFQAMAASQAEYAQYQQSYFTTLMFNVIKGIREYGTVGE